MRMPSDDEIGRRRLADIRHHWAGTQDLHEEYALGSLPKEWAERCIVETSRDPCGGRVTFTARGYFPDGEQWGQSLSIPLRQDKRGPAMVYHEALMQLVRGLEAFADREPRLLFSSKTKPPGRVTVRCDAPKPGYNLAADRVIDAPHKPDPQVGTKAKLEALIAKAEQRDIKPENRAMFYPDMERGPRWIWTPSRTHLAYALIAATWYAAMVLLMWGGR